MNPTLARFVADTERENQGRMRSLEDLLARGIPSEDWLDACVVGGATLTDVLAGRVAETDLPPELVEAFHAQYPHAGGLVEKIQELHDDPEALRGLVSGLKGKLFELEYVDFLNDGHLPAGHLAELAASPTQAGWDVVIHGPDGSIVEQLQLKATADLQLIHQALERYPDFDIVVPSDVFDAAEVKGYLAGHVVDSGIDLQDVADQVGGAIDTAASAGPDLFPEMAFLFIAAHFAYQLAQRERSPEAILRAAGRRAVKAGIAGALGGAAAWLAGPAVGVPVSIAARLALSRVEIMADYQRSADERLVRVHAIEAKVWSRSADAA